MRKIFQYSAIFYFVCATQNPYADSGATIAIESPMMGANPATWSPSLDTVSTAEPMMYATKIDPVMESNIITAKPEPMLYTANIDPVMENTVSPTTAMDSPEAVPTMAMMMRGAPLAMSPKATMASKKPAPIVTKSSILGANPATWSPKLKTVASTAAKPVKSAPKPAINAPRPQPKLMMRIK
jgi:hypothetical protein